MKLRTADPGAQTGPWAGGSSEAASSSLTSSPVAVLEKLIEGSSAEIAWLLRAGKVLAVAPRGSECDVVATRRLVSLPRPPLEAMLVHTGDGAEPWARWCAERGLRSCAAAPVVSEDRIGTMVLASRADGVLDASDLSRLEMAAWLAARGWESDERADALRREFADVCQLLHRGLTLDRAMKAAPGVRSLARVTGRSLDATYCRIASVSDGWLVILASAGHRPPAPAIGLSVPLSDLFGCREALRRGRPLILDFEQVEPASSVERHVIFTPRTRSGTVLPFSAGAGINRLLIVGEERLTRAPRPTAHRRDALNLVADRLGEMLRVSDLLGRQRSEEKRRQTKAREQAERRRLARERHDVIGQALSAVLMQVRAGMEHQRIDLADLRDLETITQGAVDAASALAYDLRGLEEGIDPTWEARASAETALVLPVAVSIGASGWSTRQLEPSPVGESAP